MKTPKKLTNRLQSRKDNNALRSLTLPSTLVDFSSNDYLGFAQSETIFKETHQYLINHNFNQNGATGSRLLSGNYYLYNDVEKFLSDFHQTTSATIFNSGYDANVGFFSSVPQRGDFILYDAYSHASIRDGIQLSNAKAFKFLHNDLEDLEKMLKRLRPLDCAQGDKDIQSNKEMLNQVQHNNAEIYVVTESVFSMDGDSPDLVAISKICKKYNAFLIVDEAHAIGVFGAGLVQKLNLQNDVFARIITFGKAMGCHGAAILGSKSLQNYLVNFARSFIYTTGLPPHSIATIKMAYQQLRLCSSEFEKNEQICIENPQNQLQKNIHHFIKEVKRLQLNFIPSCSAIHCCIIPENSTVKLISEKLHQNGFDVKAILSPTVPKGKERLRFCLHSYNSTEEISEVLEFLSIFVNN
ncbi:aminotransferase class I/II-fold pyridoxal phosphate-dependent enzyme [Polaribacter sp. R77954]|uniref:aminotransferase class I/II-fold pyridoxal phosphate-dependent enzyme n=1 Tax=Polaribacter sp. R77954 TaxID=3093870 RepID=UPI0037C81130